MTKKIVNLIIVTIIILILAFFWWQLRGQKGEEQQPLQPGVEKQTTDSSLSDVKAKGSLVIGTFSELEPMTYKNEAGENIGYDISIIREITAKLGVGLEIKEIFFSDLFWAVETGEVDLAVSAITITPERSEKMLFSIPYLNGGQSILVRTDNEDILKPKDLADKKVGAAEGTVCEEAAKKYAKPSLLSLYNFDEVDHLLSEEVDAVVKDYISAVISVKKHPDKLKIVGEPFTEEYYGMAAKKENVTLMDEINKILREMKRSGQLEEIKAEWMD